MHSDHMPDTAPIHAINVSEIERQIAMCIPSESIGVGRGHDIWLIFSANKETGNVACSVSLTLPAVFLPR